ncbi:MAG: OadG family transporter subunit [Propionibacteriaceae bacterium]
MMTLVGMGTVFLLLALLMAVLYLVGMLDRPKKEEPLVLAATVSATNEQPSVLSVDEIAALSLALAMEDDTAATQQRTATHTRRPGSWTNSGRTRLHNHAQRI